MLPTEKTKPLTDPKAFKILLYGKPKIGKSTFFSRADNALFLATEPGLNALEVYQTPIRSWEDFLNVCAEIAAGKHSFSMIVLDTVDNLYKFCSEYICKKEKIDHEADLEYGKGWALVNREFDRALVKLSNLPYGLGMISHAQDVDQRAKGKEKHTFIQPTLPKKCRDVVINLVDMILYADIDVSPNGKEIRVIRTMPSNEYEAGDRTGKLPPVLPLSYYKFVEFFKEGNGQPASAKDDTPATEPSTEAAPSSAPTEASKPTAAEAPRPPCFTEADRAMFAAKIKKNHGKFGITIELVESAIDSRVTDLAAEDQNRALIEKTAADLAAEVERSQSSQKAKAVK